MKKQRFEKVVEWKDKETNKINKFDAFFLKGSNPWTFCLKNWLACLFMILVIPFFVIQYRLEFKKKVYWRKMK